MFHSFFSSLARSKYLSPFSFSFIFTLWSAGTAKSTIRRVLFFCWVSQGLVVWSSDWDYVIRLYHKLPGRILLLCIYHLFGWLSGIFCTTPSGLPSPPSLVFFFFFFLLLLLYYYLPCTCLLETMYFLQKKKKKKRKTDLGIKWHIKNWHSVKPANQPINQPTKQPEKCICFITELWTTSRMWKYASTNTQWSK